MLNDLRVAIASQKQKSSLDNISHPDIKIKNIPYTYIVDSDITRSYALSKIDKRDVVVPKQMPILAQKKAPKQLEEVIQQQRDLETLSYIGEEYLGPDAALFIEAMQEEKYEEMRKKKEERLAASEAKYRGEKPSSFELKKASSQKKKSWKDYLKIKDFSKWFSFSLGYSTSLRNLSEPNSSREALKLSISVSPIKYFFLGTTLMKDINSYTNPYYQPDFSYSFGYFDWHPDTWGFSYSNYANNKFTPLNSKERFNFDQGTWEVNYKTKIKDTNIKGTLKHTPSSNDTKFDLMANRTIFKKISLTGTWSHYFRYRQERFTLTAKRFLYKKFFAQGSVYLYSDLDKQTSLEPDYAYTFGWRDTRPFYPTITYSNYYTPTRWGWRDQKGPSFRDGSLSVSIKLKF